MGTHIITGYSYECVRERLEDLDTLLRANRADECLAEIVSIVIRHQLPEIIFYLIND